MSLPRLRLLRLVGVLIYVSVAARAPAVAASHLDQDVSSTARGLLDTADRLRARGEKEPFEQSIAEYRRVLEIANREPLRDLAARAQLGAGLSLELLGRSEEALPMLRQARDGFRALGDRTREAEALVGYSYALGHTGQSDTGGAAAREAVEIARAAGDRRIEAEALAAIFWTGTRDDSVRAGLEQAIAIQRELGPGPGLARALNALGLLVFFGKEGPKAAIPYYEEALRVARAAADARQTGSALSLLGFAALQLGNFEESIRYDEEALPLSRRAGDRMQESYTLGDLGLSLYYHGRVRAALAIFQQHLALVRELKDRKREGYAVQNVGLALLPLGRRSEADELFNQALEIHRSNKDPGEEAATLLNLAAARGLNNDYHAQLELSLRALELARQAGAGRTVAAAQSYVGFSHSVLGRYREAIDAFTAAMKLAVEQQDKRQEVQIERVLGQLFALLGNRPEALAHFDRSMALGGGATDRVSALSHSAVLRAEAGDLVTARKQLDEAARLARQIDEPRIQARLENSRAALAVVAGDMRQAARLFEQELGTRRRIKDRSGEASVLTQLGKAQAALGNRSRALDSFREALASSSAERDPVAEAVTLTALMGYWRDQRQPVVAAFFGKQAINLFQQTRANLLLLDPATQRAFIDSRAHIYRDLADLLLQTGRLPEAQQVLDLLKQEEYLDFVRRDDGQQTPERRRVDMTPVEAAQEKQYRAIQDRVVEIGRKYGVLRAQPSWSPEEQQELETLENQLAAANGAFLQTLKRLAAELGRPGRPDSRLLAVQDAQALMPTLRELGPGTVVVYTLVTPTRYHALLITPDARKAFERRISASELSRRVFEFRQALQNPKVDPRPLAQELYGALVGPIARDLDQARAETVLWVLDGVLRYVPIVALHDGRQYVAEKYRTVIFTPASRSNLKDLPSRSRAGFGAGVSRPTAGFVGLPAVSEELRRIFRQSATATDGVVTGRVLLDEAFTAAAFRSGLREHHPIVHVATHFQLHPGDDNDSFLLLGDGGRLTVADLRRAPNIFEGVELLTISACNTAIGGASGNGDEFESFGAWAQLNGAKAVVASLWPVADASTQTFMETFYRARVEGGLDKAEAIRRAQLSLLHGGTDRSTVPASAPSPTARGVVRAKPTANLPAFVPTDDAPWAHPYYWAPFILMGNWR